MGCVVKLEAEKGVLGSSSTGAVTCNATMSSINFST